MMNRRAHRAIEMTVPFVLAVLAILAFFLLGRAYAQAGVPSPEEDAGGFLQLIAAAAVAGKWKVLSGLVIVGLVYGLRIGGARVFPWLKTATGGLVLGLAVSFGGTIGMVLAAGMDLTLSVVLSALGSAATAAGLWQWISKRLPAVDKAVR